MAEKVKVSREVADAIEYVKECYVNPFETIMRIKSHGGFVEKKTVVLNTVGFLDLGQIMINGYEIEQTPEEKLLISYIENQEKWVNYAGLWNKGFVEGIRFAINTLNIQIEGINK